MYKPQATRPLPLLPSSTYLLPRRMVPECEMSTESDKRSTDRLDINSSPAEAYSISSEIIMDDHSNQPTIIEEPSQSQGKSEIALTDQTNLLPLRKIFIVFNGLGLCVLVSCLDSTIVATALPKISAEFNAGSVSSWVPSAYLLTSTAFQPLCKRFIIPMNQHTSLDFVARWSL